MLGKWDHSRHATPFSYGQDDVTYRKAMEFLDGCSVVEDWGCGTAFAKKFLKSGTYVGIDGSKSRFSDKVVDLREYRSKVDGILIRHVLEHNFDWRKVLENAIASFQKKMVLILFTPFRNQTESDRMNLNDVPDLCFKKEDITDYFKPFQVREETLVTKTQYSQEHIFYIQK